MHPISVHHLTAAALSPKDFIDTVARAGGEAVSLFTDSQGDHFPCVRSDNARAVGKQLRDTGVALINIDAFMLTPTSDIKTFRADLARGAELGARSATAIIFDADRNRGKDNLQRLSEIAAELGLNIALEFMPFAPIARNLREADHLLDDIDAPNLGITVDVLHLIRSGGTAADLPAVSPQRITTVQLCDSASMAVTTEYIEEAASQRGLPGDGIFPLAQIIAAAPESCVLEIESPHNQNDPARARIEQGLDYLKTLN